jgi:hypothetical protein
MSKFNITITILLALSSTQSLACRRITPNQDSINSYSTVFLGRVTGIHLAGYENGLIGKPDGYIEGIGGFNITDGSASVVITAVPLKAHHGNPDKIVEIELVGCTNPLPNLKERGLFFVNPKSESAITVWESDTKSFQYWLEYLKLSGHER